MGLKPTFDHARRILKSLDPEDRDALLGICRQIQDAQESLARAAAPYLDRCIHRCQGLCCRNAHLDEIIGLEDFIYILALEPTLADEMAGRLQEDKGLFTRDCVLLANGTGPCILPAGVRPEVCVTSFCMPTPAASKAIAAVKWRFKRLAWCLLFSRLRTCWRKISA
jgi:hypothetical protein